MHTDMHRNQYPDTTKRGQANQTDYNLQVIKVLSAPRLLILSFIYPSLLLRTKSLILKINGMAQLIEQSFWDKKSGPMNVHRPSPAVATKGDEDPQWLTDLLRDGVSHSL